MLLASRTKSPSRGHLGDTSTNSGDVALFEAFGYVRAGRVKSKESDWKFRWMTGLHSVIDWIHAVIDWRLIDSVLDWRLIDSVIDWALD